MVSVKGAIGAFLLIRYNRVPAAAKGISCVIVNHGGHQAGVQAFVSIIIIEDRLSVVECWVL